MIIEKTGLTPEKAYRMGKVTAKSGSTVISENSGNVL